MCKQACVTLLSYFSQNSEISSLPLLFTYLPLSSLLRQLSLSPAGASVVPRLFCLCLTRSGSAVFFLTFAHLVAESVHLVWFVWNCVKIVCMVRCVIPLGHPIIFLTSGGRVLKLGIFPCNFSRVALTFCKLFTTLFFLIFLTLYRVGAYLLS